MKKSILKLLGIDFDYLNEIREYNKARKQEEEFAEFRMLEREIKQVLARYENNVLYILRQITEDGFPVKRYKELSDKYKLYNDELYKAVMGEVTQKDRSFSPSGEIDN